MTQEKKFNTDDAIQCSQIKSGTHGFPNMSLTNFRCFLVDVFICERAQTDSNASSREDYILQMLTVL